MVKANDSWLSPLHCTWQLPNFNCMSTSVEPVQPGCLPAFVNPDMYASSANMMMPEIAVPRIPSSKILQINEAQGLPQSLPLPIQNLHPAKRLYLEQNPSVFSYGFAGETASNAIPEGQRRFVIFDQSGNETRLIYNSFCPTIVKPAATAAEKLIGGSYLSHEEHAAKMNQISLTVPKLQEVSNENHLSVGESEMHEDTEEINALLYSDDDYDDDDDDDNVGDDDTASTAHSPILIRSCAIQGQAEEITEEVADSDGQNKRQKLLDGGYKRSPLTDTTSSTEVAEVHGCDDYYDDGESSYVFGQKQEEKRLVPFGDKQSKKDKVRATLKILESIIPGAKDKDPLLVLDVAIDYLKSLKLKAKTLGVSYI